MKNIAEQKSENTDCFDPGIFVEKVSDELFCPINLGVLNNPVSCPFCGACFCKGCLVTWLGIKKNCPKCRKIVLEKNLQGVILPLKNQILALKVGCKNPGCEWKGELEKSQTHSEKICDFVREQCPNCKAKIMRKDLNLHVSTLCSMVIVPCEYCQAMMQKRDLLSHYEICPKIEVECQLCKRKVIRSDLQTHAGEICEERLSDCIFGCGLKGVKVKQLAKHYFAEHEVDFVNKLSQMPRLQKENEALRHKIEALDLSENIELRKGASSENAKKATGLKIYSEDLNPGNFFSTDSFSWIKSNLIDDRKFKLEQIHYQTAPNLSIKHFHEDCDATALPTIFCVKTEGGQIIGAYTRLSWNGEAQGTTDDPDAVLFSATHKRKFPSRGTTNIIRSVNQGPSIKDAIHIFDKSKTNICFLGKGLEKQFNMGDFTGKEEVIIGKPNQMLKNYYVFKISHLFVFAVKPM